MEGTTPDHPSIGYVRYQAEHADLPRKFQRKWPPEVIRAGFHAEQQEDDINNLKNEVSDIKNMLNKIIEKLDGSNNN